MKDKKLLYVVLLVFIFFLSVGLTYAYFVTTVSGNGNDIKASVGTLNIVYTDGPEIVARNVQPSWTTTKTVSVENTGTLDTNYSLEWASLVNEITNDELLMSATCTRTKDGSVSGTCSSIPEAPIASVSGSIVHNVNIESGYKHTYVITFSFIETSSAQNYNQGKAFNGVINVLGETYTLAGVLYDSNGDPIVGARLEMHSNPKSAITDANGNFEIIGLESGDHTITVKNSSDEVIATDSINLTGGNSVGVNSKKIIVSKYTNTATIEMRLGASNINTMSPVTTLTDKILMDNTAYADNTETQYVKGEYTDIYDFIITDANVGTTFKSIKPSEAEELSTFYYDTYSGLYFSDSVTEKYLGTATWDSQNNYCSYDNFNVFDLASMNTVLENECHDVYELFVPAWNARALVVLDLEERTDVENHIFTGLDPSKNSVGYNGEVSVDITNNQLVNLCYSTGYCGGGVSSSLKNKSPVLKINSNFNKDYSIKKLIGGPSYYEYASEYTFDEATGKFVLDKTDMSNSDALSTGFTESSVGNYACYYGDNDNSHIEVEYGGNSATCDELVKILSVDGYGNVSSADIISTKRELSNGKGLYYTTKSEDSENGRRVYYYSGNVENNYLTFGGFCWRIVRTAEDGGVKVRFGGTPTEGACPQTGEPVSIGNDVFNDLPYSKKSAGYMYGNSSNFEVTNLNSPYNISFFVSNDIYYSSSYTYDNETEEFSLSGNIVHGLFNSLCTTGSCSIANYYTCSSVDSNTSCEILKKFGSSYDGSSYMYVDYVYPSISSIGELSENVHNSEIKAYIDNWYENNLLSYSSYIADTLYCNDRKVYKDYSELGYKLSLYDNYNIYKKVSYACPQNNDKFTVSSSNGNGKLTYPIGLLTLDEVLFAGGENQRLYNNSFNNYYLYTGNYYWLMTPAQYLDYYSFAYQIKSSTLNYSSTDNTADIVPVITLKASVVASSGNGTYNNPYVIE